MSKVFFYLERDIFHTSEDVKCTFEIQPSLEASNWDYVSVLPVGWHSGSAYKTYEYIRLLLGYKKGDKARISMTFPSKNLPKDEEYYQFCYNSSKHGVCGASGPFQFSSTMAKEFVEEECEGMMVIRPRTDVMQEEIQSLSHKVMMLSTERDQLQSRIDALENILSMRDQLISNLQLQVQKFSDIEKAQEEKYEKLESQTDVCRLKMDVVELSKQEVVKELKQEREKMATLENKIKEMCAHQNSLQSHIDTINGENQSLTDELNAYKIQVTESQTKVAQSTKSIDKLNKKLEVALNQCTQFLEECEELKKVNQQKDDTIKQINSKYAKVMEKMAMVESKHNDVTHELQNANDKLMACHAMKTRLSSDLEAYEITQQRMSNKFEEQESELQQIKEKLEQKNKELALMKETLISKEKSLHEKTESLCSSELQIGTNMVEIRYYAERLNTETQEREEVEKKMDETCKHLDITLEDLKMVTEERDILKRRVNILEDELKTKMELRDQQLAELATEVEKKTEMIKKNEENLTEAKIELSNAQMLYNDLRRQVDDCNIKQEQMDRINREHLHTANELNRRITLLTEEKDLLEKKVQDLEWLKSVSEIQQDKEAFSSLQQAYASLSSRMEDKESDMKKLIQWAMTTKASLKREVSQREMMEKEYDNIRKHLETGKQMFIKKTIENEKLTRLLKKEVDQLERRATDGSTADLAASETESEAKKYRQMYHIVKEENQRLQAALDKSQSKVNSLEHTLEGTMEDLVKCQVQVDQLKVEKAVPEMGSSTRDKDQQQPHVDQQQPRVDQQQPRVDQQQPHVDQQQPRVDQQQPHVDQLMFGNPYTAGKQRKEDTEKQATQQPGIIRSTLEMDKQPTKDAFGVLRGDFLSKQVAEGTVIQEVLCQDSPAMLPSNGKPVVAEKKTQEVFQDSPAMLPSNGEPKGQATQQPGIIRSTLDMDKQPTEDTFRELMGPSLYAEMTVGTQEEITAMLPSNGEPPKRLMDVIGEGMKICPFCQKSILASADFEEHVATHLGRICPVCRKQADDSMSADGFEQHVNKCLDQESATAPDVDEVD